MSARCRHSGGANGCISAQYRVDSGAFGVASSWSAVGSGVVGGLVLREDSSSGRRTVATSTSTTGPATYRPSHLYDQARDHAHDEPRHLRDEPTTSPATSTTSRNTYQPQYLPAAHQLRESWGSHPLPRAERRHRYRRYRRREADQALRIRVAAALDSPRESPVEGVPCPQC